MTTLMKDCLGDRPDKGREECEICSEIVLCSLATLKKWFPNAYVSGP